MPRKPGSELLRGCGLYLLCVSGGRLPGELDPASRCCFPWTESPGPRAETRDHRDAQKCASDLQRYRAAYRNRTDDLRITRGTIPSRTPASCTDSTDHRTDGTRRAGTIQGPVSRPRPCITVSCSLCVTSLRHSHQDSQHAVDPHLSHAYRGLANCGKARQLEMTLRHEQPVAG